MSRWKTERERERERELTAAEDRGSAKVCGVTGEYERGVESNLEDCGEKRADSSRR